MKYFLTDIVLKKSITGTYNQTSPSPKNSDRSWFPDPYNFTQIQFDEFPNFIPKAYFELEEKGKYSDIVRIHNTHAKGFLISPRVKALWEDFNIFSCQYYPAKLASENGEIRDYFLFHMAAKDLPGIDFERSTFNNEEEFLGIDDNDVWHYGQKKINKLSERVGQNIILNKLYFTPNFPKYDLFYVPYFMFLDRFFISENLVKAMKKEKMMGLKYLDQIIIDEF